MDSQSRYICVNSKWQTCPGAISLWYIWTSIPDNSMACTISAITLAEVDPERNAAADLFAWMLMGSIGLEDLSKTNSASNPTRKSTSETDLASLSNEIRNNWYKRPKDQSSYSTIRRSIPRGHKSTWIISWPWGLVTPAFSSNHTAKLAWPGS